MSTLRYKAEALAILAFGMFPVLWLVAIWCECATRSFPLGVFGTGIHWLGVLRYCEPAPAALGLHPYSRSCRPHSQVLPLLAIGFGILIASWWLRLPIRRNYSISEIGETTDNPPHYFWGSCDVHDLPPERNGYGDGSDGTFYGVPGMVFVDSDFAYFVFVHGVAEASNRANLVLRFHTADENDEANLKLRWRGRNLLTITADDVGFVTKERDAIGQTTIRYNLTEQP